MFRTSLLVAMMVAGTWGLSACGDDNETSRTGGGSTPTSGGDARKFVAIVDAAGAGDFTSSARLGIDAALKEINDAGGVDGKPLEVELCKAASTPDSAAKCARDAVRDREVLGIVGNFMQGPDGALPVLEKAGMASIGDYALKTISLESDVSFPIASIASGFVNAALLGPAALKAKRVAVAAVDVPVSRAAEKQVDQVLQSAGAKLAQSVFIPVTATDLSAPVQTLRNLKADAIIVILPDQGTKQFLQSYRQVDKQTPLIVTGTTVSKNSLEELASAADNLYVGMQFALDSAGNKRFEQLAGDVGDEAAVNDIARNSYAAVKLAARGLQGLESPTRATLKSALDKVSDFSSEGLIPPLDYTKKRAMFPRAAHRAGYFAQAKDGSLVPVRDKPVPTLPDAPPKQ
jgi:branched-chain amino acid transport system substrate-binding protein